MPDEFLAGLKVEEREAMWRGSVTAPEVAPAERVILVAHEAGTVLGFAAAGHARGDDELGLGAGQELFQLLRLGVIEPGPRERERSHPEEVQCAQVSAGHITRPQNQGPAGFNLHASCSS